MYKKLTLLVILVSFNVFSQTKSNLDIFNQGILSVKKTNDTIPIKIWNDLVLIKMKIGNIEGDFLWDNGFSISAIDTTYFNVSSIKKSTKTESKVNDGINKKIKLSHIVINHIKLGSTSIDNLPVLMINTKNNLQTDKKILGVVGQNIIKKLNWKFDFDNKIAITSKNVFQEKGKVINFQLQENNMMFTELSINGHIAGVHIDFGHNSDHLQLPFGAKELFKNSKKMISNGIAAFSLSGVSEESTLYQIKDFNYSINQQVFNHPIELSLNSTETDFARIGNRPFRHSNLLFNHTSNQLILLPRTTNINPIPKKSFGFRLAKINGKIIIAVKSSNPNIKKYPDLKIGQEIKSLNGKESNAFGGNDDIREYQIKLILKNKNLTLKTLTNKVIVLTPEVNLFE